MAEISVFNKCLYKRNTTPCGSGEPQGVLCVVRLEAHIPAFVISGVAADEASGRKAAGRKRKYVENISVSFDRKR